MTESREHAGRLSRDLVDGFVPVQPGDDAQKRALRFIAEDVIAHPTLPDVFYDDGYCWVMPLPRSHGRYLHGLLFLADWHETVLSRSSASAEQVTRLARKVAALILQWQEVAQDLSDTSMAYHDETTAQRLMQLCRFLDDHDTEIREGQRESLASLAISTAELLLADDFHAGVNNHGMFQDLSLLRFAASSEDWLPHAQLVDEAVSRAIDRLIDYFSFAFTPDGAHVENSPAYHLMVARSLRDVIPAVRAVEPEHAETLAMIYGRAERFAVHSIMPNGTIAPLGDTKVIAVANSGHRTTFCGPAFRYAISQGSEGESPPERTVVFSQGGYAMHRTAWGDPNAYVATFKAAYLSQYHHHNDDLALTIFGQGRWLLSEAGPNGYDYKNPLTKYAYSQRAHNVVLIDGRSLPRVDAEPGGVALVDCSRDDASLSRRVPSGVHGFLRRGHRALGHGLSDQGVDTLLHVKGTNSRFRSARHERRVSVAEPGGRLQVTVVDTVEHQDNQKHEHEILWHVGAGVETVLHGHCAELFVGQTKVLEICWSGDRNATARMLTPQDGGRVQAMRFPTFGRHEPGSVIRVASRGKRLSLTTTIHGTTPAD